jgi:Signal transduction histidine kinase
MRIHWWKSIRWHLALGSVCIVLVATLLLTLTVLLAVRYNYVDEQQKHLDVFASEKAQTVGADYAYSLARLRGHNGTHVTADPPTTATVKLVWRNALNRAMSAAQQNTQQSASVYVLDTHEQLLYPLAVPRNAEQTIVRLAGTSYPKADLQKLALAIDAALHQRTVTQGSLGQRLPRNTTLPFCVVPIFSEGLGDASAAPIGVLVATAPTGSALSFLSIIGNAALWATLVIVLLAAVGAIVFARTITRPLVKLSQASRILAAGDYSAQVSTDAPGELGELARSFNEMATQLKSDVDELRRQEIWRRELIMNITHDLATPLTAIAGLGEALVDGIGQSREDYEATGRIIMNETLRLRRLVQDLHVMAKVEAGALEPKKKLLRLAPLVDQVFATMITEFERHRVEPINEIPYNLAPIAADPDMLTRVFANLCSNALRHTPAGGSIFIRVVQRAQDLVISVADTGEGIPEGALARIFERFYRADNARRSTTGGSGLGLAIVQAIVVAHGGTIWAENNPTGGACISFSLPVAQTDAATIVNTPTVPLSHEHTPS